MQAFYSICSSIGSYVRPDPLKVGYTDEKGYKPRIIITGEKTSHYVLDALTNCTDQQPTWIGLGSLTQLSSKYDLEKDLLLLIIHKNSGNCPIRGFAPVDGPLESYKDAIFNFKKCAAVIILDSNETLPIAEIQRQANKQLPLKNRVIAINNLWNNRWNIALQIQTVFKD